MDTFGTVQLVDGQWVIACEPQVRSRLKRVFASAVQHATELIRLSDTPEHARDLQWFMERYPMKVLEPKRLKSQARAHQKNETQIRDLLMNRVQLPLIDTLVKPPHDYQVFASQMLELRGGLLLADQIGVGKTISAICGMVKAQNLPVVVVVPAHLTTHWHEKLAEFAPQLHSHIVRLATPYPLIKKGRSGPADLRTDRVPDVLIITYHKLRGWAETLNGVTQYIVFEECQQLRRPDSAIYRACELLASKARLRLGLSATPVYGYGAEFYWAINVLCPDVLGTREEFGREWCDGELLKKPEDFAAYLKREGIMLRRTRKDVGKELKPVQKIPHLIDADTEVLNSLKSDAVALANIIVGSNEKYRGEKMRAAGEFDILVRQATGVAKAPYVADFVRMLLESGESVVLFGWHRAVYDIWRERLADFTPLFYTGEESPSQKAMAKQLFVEGKHKLLIMSLRSGSGVDGLQRVCSTAVIGELDWSPMVIEQCIGRVDREGQEDFVTAYYMLSQEGSDPIMQDVLGIKYEQSEGVLNPQAEIIEPVQADPEHVKRMARAYLERVHAIPESPGLPDCTA